MTKPICQDPRAGGPDNDWQDTPCGKSATAEYSGRPVCQDHLEAAERREIEAIAWAFFDGVPLEEVRRIAALGGLKATLASHARLVDACSLALPFLWNAPLDGAMEAFERVQFARNAGLPFHNQEDAA